MKPRGWRRTKIREWTVWKTRVVRVFYQAKASRITEGVGSTTYVSSPLGKGQTHPTMADFKRYLREISPITPKRCPHYKVHECPDGRQLCGLCKKVLT